MVETFEKIRNGDETAYRQVFVEYYPPLCQYATRFVPDADAEDIVQDFMVYLWEHRKTIVVGVSLKSYLFAGIKNRCLNAIRDRKVREAAHLYIYEQFKDRFDDPNYYLFNELAENYEAAIAKLPDTYRDTFVMNRFDGKTYKDIAKALNISEKTVEYRIYHAKKFLSKELKDFLPLLVWFVV